MTYNYKCGACNKSFDLDVIIVQRDMAKQKPCPLCNASGKIERVIQSPAISFEGSKTTIRRAGSGWNDVLKKIDRYAGKNSTVDHY
jgi:putative FmdB family regulatory protein